MDLSCQTVSDTLAAEREAHVRQLTSLSGCLKDVKSKMMYVLMVLSIQMTVNDRYRHLNTCLAMTHPFVIAILMLKGGVGAPVQQHPLDHDRPSSARIDSSTSETMSSEGTPQITLPIHLMDHAHHAPTYGTLSSAGMDLYAASSCEYTNIHIAPGKTAIIPTGVRVAIPEGYEGQIRPRSGLAAKHAVTVLNSPGTIDSDYRGELKVILINHGSEDFVVTKGMRVAQMVIAKYESVRIVQLDNINEDTERGVGGFGSTGV